MKLKIIKPENKMKTICAWCKKHHKNDKWVEPNKSDNEGDPRKISHGICPECAVKHFSE